MKTVIKITATATIAVDNEDMASVVRGYSDAEAVKKLMEEKMQNVSFKTKIATMRDAAPEAAPKSAATEEASDTDAGDDPEGAKEAYKPIEFPASWAAEEGTFTIADVKTKARHKASLSAEEFEALSVEESDALVVDMIAEMGLKDEDAE